jgi:hypothetical protein
MYHNSSTYYIYTFIINLHLVIIIFVSIIKYNNIFSYDKNKNLRLTNITFRRTSYQKYIKKCYIEERQKRKKGIQRCNKPNNKKNLVKRKIIFPLFKGYGFYY